MVQIKHCERHNCDYPDDGACPYCQEERQADDQGPDKDWWIRRCGKLEGALLAIHDILADSQYDAVDSVLEVCKRVLK